MTAQMTCVLLISEVSYLLGYVGVCTNLSYHYKWVSFLNIYFYL